MLKLAVIDDHPLFRTGVRVALAPERDLQVVAEAADARQAYVAIESARPDLVLLDETLPGPDGLSAVREILRRRPRQNVLMIAAHAEEYTVAEALAVGALGTWSKEQPAEDLVTAVRIAGSGQTYLPPGVSPAAVESRVRRGRVGPLGVLSGREREVFELLVRGLSNDKVAGHLEISRRTVETHRSRILKKLQVHSAVDLIRLAARHGLLRV
jgi:two-component system response regulator NreC